MAAPLPADELTGALAAAADDDTRFESILGTPVDAPAAPECFRDLNLDQLVEAIVAPWKDYALAPFFHAPLADADAVAYRQEAMQDLEVEALRKSVSAFADGMREMRQWLALADKLQYRHEKERRFLCAVQRYCAAVERFAADLRPLALDSRGMRGWRRWLAAYVESDPFLRLRDEAAQTAAGLAAIRYALLIHGDGITVMRDETEIDYSAAVEQTFAKFRRDAVKDYRARLAEPGSLNHVEAQVLERVARLHPQPFSALDAFHARHADFLDATVERFDREVRFYVAYLDFIAGLRRAGLSFCRPSVSAASKEVGARDTFDLALAARLTKEGAAIVANDFELRGAERIFVVSGPNQGGKTTFARLFGQLHYLAALGCPVPGSSARLYLFDRLFTHFEREEDVRSLRGKLHDDLVRIHAILAQATPRSIVIVNEIFASTTLRDAITLGRRVMAALSRLDLLAVYVTFIDELASFDDKTVSLVGSVDARDPSVRTFRLVRRPADGLAYALAIAEKYRVTGDDLRRRIRA